MSIPNLRPRGNASTMKAGRIILNAPNKDVYGLEINNNNDCMYGLCTDLMYSSLSIYTDENGNVYFMRNSAADIFADVYIWKNYPMSSVLCVVPVTPEQYHKVRKAENKILANLTAKTFTDGIRFDD